MPDEWFMKIVEPNGYPVALFGTHMMDIETGRRDRLISREGLVSIIENVKREGRSAAEYERALTALDEAIQKWAQTPWDGR